MRIGIYENTPVLREMLEAKCAHRPFGERLTFHRAVSGKHYDLILSDLPYFPMARPFLAPLYLFPDHARLPEIPAGGCVFLGGMSPHDDVSFSSIGENEALLCLQKEVFLGGKSLLPFEKKVPFDRSYSLYKNLAAGLTFALSEMIFTEEP